jgi:pimeloyl-ACP methyl ester carboxylesterase
MFKGFIEQFLFFPNKDLKKNPSVLSIDYENINLNYENESFHGWFIQGNYKNSITQNKCILFFHGNAGNISFRLNYIEKLYDLGFSLLFFDYPGFGLSSGIPNEDLCIKSGCEFYNYLINIKNFSYRDIILYGESIGGSIASSVANIYNVKYLILQSTFTDIKEIIKIITTFNFFSNIVGFETLQNLKIRFKLNKINKKMKTLIIHSTDDELIDISHAHKLYKYADKFLISNGSHSNITIDDDFIFNLLSFIKD